MWKFVSASWTTFAVVQWGGHFTHIFEIVKLRRYIGDLKLSRVREFLYHIDNLLNSYQKRVPFTWYAICWQDDCLQGANALISKDCNETQQCFYVYKSVYLYSEEHKRSREQQSQIDKIVNGVFTYAKSYLLKPRIKDLKREVKVSATNVASKISEILSKEVVDPRQDVNVQFPSITLLC